VFRRTQAGGGAAAAGGTGVIDIDGMSFDPAGRSLTGRDGKTVPLTSGEFDVLANLVEHAGHPVARDDLLERAHGRRWNPLDRAIDQHISNLRVKMERDPTAPVLIQTVRGVGYILVTRGDRSS
jgi:DNA-binding response OmpR family regulator